MRKKDMLPMAGAKGWRLIERTLAGVLVSRHCWRRERDWGFWLEEEEGSKESYGR